MALTIGGGPFDRPRRGSYNFDLDDAAPNPILYLEGVLKHIRGFVENATVVDSRAAAILYETGKFPQWYFPAADVRMDMLERAEAIDDPVKGRGAHYTLRAAGREIVQAAWTFDDAPAAVPGLAGMIAIDFEKIDRWFEEDEQILGEPRDPYHRFDCRRSSDLVEVRVGQNPIARTTRSVKLFETGAPIRYYVPLADVVPGALSASATRGYCPYKGAEAYYDVTVGGKVLKDAAWTITEPLGEAVPLIGYVAFWREPIEIAVDGTPAAV